MRIIEFRGKEISSGEWVYGNFMTGAFVDALTATETKRYLIDNGYFHDVLENTICQFTGLYDGTTPLYEGDVILTQEGKRKVIVFDDCAFRLATQKEYQFVMKGEHPFINDYTTLPALAEISMQPFSLIGNVYDNPELMQDE